MLHIKYTGPIRPGVETPRGIYFEHDKPVEVPDEEAKALLATGDFKTVKTRKEVSE